MMLHNWLWCSMVLLNADDYICKYCNDDILLLLVWQEVADDDQEINIWCIITAVWTGHKVKAEVINVVSPKVWAKKNCLYGLTSMRSEKLLIKHTARVKVDQCPLNGVTWLIGLSKIKKAITNGSSLQQCSRQKRAKLKIFWSFNPNWFSQSTMHQNKHSNESTRPWSQQWKY